MNRFLLPLMFSVFTCSLAFGQYETQLIKKLAVGDIAEQLNAANGKLYFSCKDVDGKEAVFVADVDSDQAELYYKHQTVNVNSRVNILDIDANYMYFNARKQDVLDNRLYLHRVSHASGTVELLTDEVACDANSRLQMAILGNKVVFKGRSLETQAQKYYYSLDLDSRMLTPLIHINYMYDHISLELEHSDGLFYICLRLDNGIDFHDFVTDGTLEGTTRFLVDSVNTVSISFSYSIEEYLYFAYRLNGQYLGMYRTKGLGQPIEPFTIVPPISNGFRPYFDTKYKFLMHHAMEGDMHLRYGEIDMNTGEFSHCFTYPDFFDEIDYVFIETIPFDTRSLLIRRQDFFYYQGFIEDCAQNQYYELPFKQGEPFEMNQFRSAVESGGALYISGAFKLENESQGKYALIRVKQADLSVKNVDETLISLFPNPANNELTITSDEMADIAIYNTMGKLMYASSVSIGTNEIDLNAFQAGMYLVKLSNGKSGKFLKL